MIKPGDVLLRVWRDPGSLSALTLDDWDPLIRLARRADLLARVAWVVRREGQWHGVPEPVRRHLEAAELLCQRQHDELRFELQDIARVLHTLPSPVLVLKGAAYVCAGWEAGRGRAAGDVDILVSNECLDEAESRLTQQGWSTSTSSEYDQRYYRRWMHELPPMVHTRRGTVLDVHHAILPLTGRLAVPSAALLARAQALPVNGLYRLSDVDALIHSALHLTHEGDFDWGLRGVVDLDALIRELSLDAAFWHDLMNRVRDWGVAVPLRHALRACRVWLHTPVPEDVMDALDAEALRLMRPWQMHVMDWMFDRVLAVPHPLHLQAGTACARSFMYLRGHWLRMPFWMLARHLAHKGWLKLREPFNGSTD